MMFYKAVGLQVTFFERFVVIFSESKISTAEVLTGIISSKLKSKTVILIA